MAEPDVTKEWSELVKRVAGVSPGATGTEAPSKVEISARGAMQGATSGWADEAAARVDQGISKIPVLRDVLPHDDRFPPLADPNVTYEQRRDAYRQANRNAQQADPKRFGAYEVGGALLQQATMANTPLRPLVTTSGPRTGAASGGLQGAIAGAGASEGETVGEVLKDAGKGSAAGAFFGGLGGYLGNEVPKGVPPPTDLQKLGGMAAGALKKEIAERRTAIGAVTKAFPQVSKAFGDPEAVLAATARPKAELLAKRDALYAAADEAAARASAVPRAVDESLDTTVATPVQRMSEMVPRSSGGVDPSIGAEARAALPDDTASLAQTQRIDASALRSPAAAPVSTPVAPPEGGMPTVHAMDKVKALEGLAASAKGPGGVEAPAVKKIANQFYAMTGGSDVVPAAQVRQFMTDYLAPDHLPTAQTSTEIAKREVYNILKDELHGHVEATLGPKQRAELEKTNQLLSGLIHVEDIAKAARNKALVTPPKAAPSAAMGEKEKIGEFFQKAPVAGGAARTIAGGLSQLSPALGRPVIDRVAGQHRQTLEEVAKAAKAGDRDTVTKTLMQQIFGD
jgi:hypothetical protein